MVLFAPPARPTGTEAQEGRPLPVGGSSGCSWPRPGSCARRELVVCAEPVALGDHRAGWAVLGLVALVGAPAGYSELIGVGRRGPLPSGRLAAALGLGDRDVEHAQNQSSWRVRAAASRRPGPPPGPSRLLGSPGGGRDPPHRLVLADGVRRPGSGGRPEPEAMGTGPRWPAQGAKTPLPACASRLWMADLETKVTDVVRLTVPR